MPLPSVSGTLVRDIDPDSWGLAHGTLLTNANSGLDNIGVTMPSYRANTFGNGAGAMVISFGEATGTARPVQDDFSIYLRVGRLKGQGSGSNWFNNAPIIDSEAPFVGNDYGLTMKANGRLTGGVGNPDTTSVGTVDLGNFGWHTISIIRTKSTGLYSVYVDGTLDLALTGNTNSLTHGANTYFGRSYSAGWLSGSYGRVLFYDDDHNTTDRQSVESFLTTDYPEINEIVSTKFPGYVVSGSPRVDLHDSKFVAYSVQGTGIGLSGTKFVAYAVLKRRKLQINPQIY